MATAWPPAGQALITLTAVTAPLTPAGERAARRSLLSPGAQVFGAATPVWAQAAAGRRRALPGWASRCSATGPRVAAGVRGVLFTARSAAGSGGGTVRLGLSYAGFAQVSGGNYGLGLGMAELPACALTTPARPACQAEKLLTSVNDAAARTVSALVTLPGRAAPRAREHGGPGRRARRTPTAAAGGPYRGDDPKPSGTWTEGGRPGRSPTLSAAGAAGAS